MNNKSKSILIITRDFPPYCPTVGWFIRVASLANYLSGNGFDVHVIVTKRAKEWDIFDVDKNIKIYTVKHPLLKYDLPIPKLHAKYSFLTFLAKIYKRIITKVFKKDLVDVDELSLLQVIKLASNIIRENNISTLLTSSPPHSIHLSGLTLKEKFTKLLWICDFRDPWTMRPLYEKNNKKIRKKHKELENKIVKSADYISVVSLGMKKMYESLNDNIAIIENGYLDVDSVEADSKLLKFIKKAKIEGRLVLGYFGTGGLSAMDDSGKDLQFLIDLIVSNSFLNKSISLVLQGNIVVNSINKFSDNTIMIDADNNDKVRENMRHIDVGLFVYSKSKDASCVMGGKLYDYIATKIPLVAFVSKNATSIIDFSKNVSGVHVCDISNKLNQIELLTKLIEEHKSDTTAICCPTDEEIKKYHRYAQYEKIIDIIQKNDMNFI